ncbi:MULTISPECIES: hypothetical protein [Lelliottia]|uniref:Uncharacterized protein n=2 Tax=Lelliottia aquatilis TaxID=2080838 RepID=A0ABX5A2S3_9ENTR|nr:MULTISPECIES: hypothetical protein [Lelliottia]POZ24009.1 hypothetical protein C3712_07260 [Lelliottia aquatilis]POZ27589.1 hypothetical protein C3708_08395 [Lelliottia sp. 7254-16]POZ29859.1 hypothetical protein C3711_01605 [Lelliottia aquatilis]POZ35424.1 hypothetical protein C3710_01605 [Lelliottia aquatilis]POZ38985.1 hypothetical protein C3709_08390 [Lelliottia aquatilis]
MNEVATILMKPGSGMSLSAVALASGLITQGLRICLIVPTLADAKKVPEIIPRNMVGSADIVTSMIWAIPWVYIFDDALRCAEEFRHHGEGELVNIALDRLSIHQDRQTRLYLFQYTA